MENILIKSLKRSLVDKEMESEKRYEPKLLSNREEKIISSIRRELESCDEFIISVAFITEGGISLLLEQFKILEEKGIKGKILTGDYLNFTEPKALRRLLKYKNIELKILSQEKFHAKGYFFRRGDLWTIVVGSSNLTQKALTTNFEWNLKINSLSQGGLVQDVLGGFDEIFTKLPETTLESIKLYEEVYKKFKELKFIQKEEKISIQPNLMQQKALLQLEYLRKLSKDKGLLVSATGTGKTYLSAFDVLKSKAKKILFIAHRKTILEKACETFKSIIENKRIDIYNGERRGLDCVFVMIQTLTKDEHLFKFSQTEFDYIIVDEVHHGGAKSYQKVISYFKPKFILGMTATPERTDDFDIFQMFDYNVVSEMRLHKALEEKLLCPFHYFGISDISINGREIDEKTSIKNLVIDERVNNILEKSEYYGYSGDILRGLIFVSRKEEARLLKDEFSKRGIKSEYLIGNTTDIKREETIERLEKGEINYIITVDIFNEGVDIPSVNQIILLRPTSSSIIYIQQLGRGLRKYEGKEFVVVLDFIGNYEKNFLIPIAISGDSSYNKDFMKRFVMDGTNMLPGESSITFEEIVKEKIFENINRTNFSTKKNIEHDFRLLKKQLGRIPMLCDFFENNLIDPSIILKYKKNYYEIIKNFEKNCEFYISEEEIEFLNFLSVFFTPAKRVHEMLILESFLEKNVWEKESIIEAVEERILDKYRLKNQRESIENGIGHLSKEIFTSLSTLRNYEKILINKEGIYYLNEKFKNKYKGNLYFKKLVDDLIRYNFLYVEKYYKQEEEETILKYKEYTKQEAFWYSNLDFNNGYQVSGYTIFEEKKIGIIFVTLEDKLESSDYNNALIDDRHFPWYSKNNRCLERNGKLTIEGKIKENYYNIRVFMKKKSSENFYYLGEVKKVVDAQKIIGNSGEPLIAYILELKESITTKIYNYFRK